MQLDHTTRDRLIRACTDDLEQSLASDAPFRREIARDGFKGFAHMTNAELIEAFQDAGLDGEDPELAKKAGILPATTSDA